MRRCLLSGLVVALSVGATHVVDASDRISRRTVRAHPPSSYRVNSCDVNIGENLCGVVEARARRISRRAARRCTCRRLWVPGYHRVLYETVQRPGHYERVWHPAKYRFVRDSCGHRVRQLVRAGHHDCVFRPGCVERVRRKVWVPGHFETRRCRRHR